MTFYTTTTRDANRAERPFSPDRADFARKATIDAFGWRFAKALDQDDFVDRRPGKLPRPSSDARCR